MTGLSMTKDVDVTGNDEGWAFWTDLYNGALSESPGGEEAGADCSVIVTVVARPSVLEGAISAMPVAADMKESILLLAFKPNTIPALQ